MNQKSGPMLAIIKVILTLIIMIIASLTPVVTNLSYCYFKSIENYSQISYEPFVGSAVITVISMIVLFVMLWLKEIKELG